MDDEEYVEYEEEGDQLLWKGVRLQLQSLLQNLRLQMDDYEEYYDDDEIFDVEKIRVFLLYGDLILRRQNAEIEKRLGHQEY